MSFLWNPPSPPPPPPPPPPPQKDDAAIQAAAEDVKKAARLHKGRRQTILTSPLGLEGSAETKKTTLGG